MPNSSNRFQNNFDFLRIFAALTVIFSHSYALLGSTSEPVLNLTGGIFTAGNIGVDIFFVISGYLIMKSWERSPHAFTYLKKRVLRVFPALIVVVFLTVFLLGPFVTTLSLHDYFSNPQTWSYLLNIFLVPLYYDWSFALPGVFANNPYPNVVNGSLWFLPYMFFMYIVVLALGLAGLTKKRLAVIPLYLLVILLLPIFTVRYLPFFNSVTVILWVICFIAGMGLYLYRDKIRLDYKIALLLLLIWALSFRTAYVLYVSSLVLPYLVIYFAFIQTPRLHKLAKYGDFSYGLLIYAFPLQQLIIYFLVDTLTPVRLFGLSIIATLPAAMLSWFLIESRALKFK